MKTLNTLLATIISGSFSLLVAQSGPMHVKLFVNDSTSVASGVQTSAMILSFDQDGNDSLDMYDMGNLSTITSGRNYSSPFTQSSEGEILTLVDHRYSLTAPMAIPFGIYTKYAANVSINALPYYSTPDSTVTVQSSFICKIYVEDLGTSMYYDVLNTTTGMIVPSNTLPTANYMLHIYPALQIQTTDEICYNSNDGAMHISNPGAANWSVTISGPAGNTTVSVAQSDTTITGLMPGSYVVKAFSNGVLTSEETATIHSHAPVVPSFTANTNTEAQNVDIFFTNTSGVNLSFTWDMGDGNSYSSIDAIHQYNTAGSYTVTLTATDGNGCTSSVTDAMLITYSAPVTGPSSFNSNTNPRSSNTTGNMNPTVNQRNGNTIVIEQNDESPVAQVSVYTVAGQHIATVDANSKITEVSVPQGGCYLVMMTMTNGEVKTERIVLGL